MPYSYMDPLGKEARASSDRTDVGEASFETLPSEGSGHLHGPYIDPNVGTYDIGARSLRPTSTSKVTKTMANIPFIWGIEAIILGVLAV